MTVSSLVPATADRYLDVTVLPQDWYRVRQGVRFELKIPEGATSVSQEIAAPEAGIWNSFSITTYEDGRKLDDLSASVGLNRTVSSYSWTEAYPSMLFIDADAPHPDRINSILTGSQANGRQLLPDVLALAKLIAPLDDYTQNVWRNESSADQDSRQADSQR